MQTDFHYYASYCAAFIAGYTHEESLAIAYSDEYTDCCSRTVLRKLRAPAAAATTQLQAELMDARTDLLGLQDITRIWASFHFLPRDLNAEVPHTTRQYRNKYRLICGPDGELLRETVELARGQGLQAVGIAMHILADTWAHRCFAGTPSLVINNTDFSFTELVDTPEGTRERPVRFNHNPAAHDDPESGSYISSLYQADENSIMNLGHGRAGHFPDYSFARYRYLPAWGRFEELVKDNPRDYRNAFCQMIYAMRFLRGERDSFETGRYEPESVEKWSEEIETILTKRQPNACADWKRFGESLSGREIPDFDITAYEAEYLAADAESRDDTFLGGFFVAALAQKSMVTNRIFRSGSLLAGLSVDYKTAGFRGIRDFAKLVERAAREARGK